MSESLSRIECIRELHSELVAAWRGHPKTCKSDRAYNLIMESLLIAQECVMITADPRYWSLNDAAMIATLIRRLDRAMDCYMDYLRESVAQPGEAELPY